MTRHAANIRPAKNGRGDASLVPPTSGRAVRLVSHDESLESSAQPFTATRPRVLPAITHELNSLLLTISAGLMTVRGEALTPRQARCAEIVDTAARQARQMLRGLLRVMREVEPVEPRDIDLIALTQEVAALGPAILPTGVRLRVTVPKGEVLGVVASAPLEAFLLTWLLADPSALSSTKRMSIELARAGEGGAVLRLSRDAARPLDAAAMRIEWDGVSELDHRFAEEPLVHLAFRLRPGDTDPSSSPRRATRTAHWSDQ